MTTQPARPQTFTQYFGIDKPQDELAFLDIYANQDIPLFLDPYGISGIGSTWSKECESQITTYFQYLVDSIKSGDRSTVSRLLGALHEVNEVALGYSQTTTDGRGIGPKQAQEIRDSFESSQAAKSGDIRDIADCAIMIPGINRDKISDITANILKKQLIQFTKEQCNLHSIPLNKVPVFVFDFEVLNFKSYFDELPVVNGKPKILLPLESVRQDPELSKDKYYRNFVIEFLRAEHTHAGDSLASVLRNGKLIVRIADLKAKYPIGSDFLYKFSKEHPQILEKYKSELRRSAINKGTRPILETKPKVLSAQDRASILAKVKAGNDGAGDFHKVSFDNLIYIFGSRLSNPDSEVRTNEGRKRIDIVFNNADNNGFFHKLNVLHHIICPKILVECKNYGREMGNPEFDQLQTRFSNSRGKFGILLCRNIKDKTSIIRRCKDILHDRQAIVIVLEDLDVVTLLNYKQANDEASIDNYMNSKLDEIIM